MVPAQDVAAFFAWAQDNRLALFPIRAWSKQPTGIVGSHAENWSRDPAQWRRWYDESRGCNFGVASGPSGIIVVDVDRGGADKFAEWCARNLRFAISSPTVITPTGGWHVYFRMPLPMTPGFYSPSDARQPNLCGKEVNVRAGRGYVVAPWSVTDPIADSSVKAKGAYRQYDIVRIAPQPLLDHCAPGRREAAIVPNHDTWFGEDGLPDDPITRSEVGNFIMQPLLALENAVPGERNDLLNKASFALGKLVAEGKLAEWRAVETLQASGEKAGIPRDEAKARSTIRSGLRAAPLVGHPEPKSAMQALLAMSVPVAPVAPLPPRLPPFRDDLVPLEPLVERLLYRGQVTILSGDSGSGKTTFLASLAAASVADLRDFRFGSFEDSSDLLMFPCCWVFLSYEGGQHIRRTTQAWHVGSGCAEKHPDRVAYLAFDDGNLVSTVGRDVVVNEAQVRATSEAIEGMRARWPALPVVLVVDNLTSAAENCMDSVQAQRFVRVVRMIARQDVAVVVLAHPPKSGSSTIYGSHLFRSLGDVVGEIEVVRRDDGEWVQWVEFVSKHREAPNGECLEVRSRRLPRPIVPLPVEWGAGNDRARSRMERDLHVPYVASIRVRSARDRTAVEAGVTRVDNVTAKPESSVRV